MTRLASSVFILFVCGISFALPPNYKEPNATMVLNFEDASIKAMDYVSNKSGAIQGTLGNNYVTGKNGMCLQWDGNNANYISMGTGKVTNYSSFMITMWINTGGVITDTWKMLATAWGTTTVGNAVVYMGLNTQGVRMTVRQYDGGANDESFFGGNAQNWDTNWHWLCYIFDGNKSRTYYDGTPCISVASYETGGAFVVPFSFADDFRLGNWSASSLPPSCKMDDIVMYKDYYAVLGSTVTEALFIKRKYQERVGAYNGQGY